MNKLLLLLAALFVGFQPSIIQAEEPAAPIIQAKADRADVIKFFFKESDAFFKQNVNNGKLNFKAVKEKPEKLNELVKLIAGVDVEELEINQTKAFYINAYNILVVKKVVDNYPIESPRQINRFFTKSEYMVAGQKLSLKQIEVRKLRKIYLDPRIEFALADGAVSGPGFKKGAYLPEELNDELEARTNRLINDERYVKEETGKILVSELLKKNRSVLRKKKISLHDFINTYRKQPIHRAKKMVYAPYDWRLNV
jgi:hypothetical protein